MPHPSKSRPQPTGPAGFPARRAALRLLDAVLRRGEPLEIAFHAATQGLKDRQDRSLAHAIAAEVLRHMTDIDALIDGTTAQRIPDDVKSRAVLRMALAQVLVLDTPPHAAIATTLPLLDGGPRKLLHGVFGTILREEAKLPAAPTLPPAVAERWAAAWGQAEVEAAQQAQVARPGIDLSLKPGEDAEDWCDRLGGDSLAPNHIRLTGQPNVPELAGYADGAWWVQDLAASLPARVLGEGAGGQVLDLCAAPGGKTMQLASSGWQVISVEQSAKRVERMQDNLDRTRLTVETVVADIRIWEPAAPVDTVLLDAPCTATGIYRRHPDVLHRIGPRQIAELAELQTQLLARAADWVKPGGRLVYATCSLEPAEGEEQITRFLADRPDFALSPIDPALLPAGLTPTVQGWLRVLPSALADKGGADGFFVAQLVRQP